MAYKTVLEYVWIGGKGEIRSKTRVLQRYVKCDVENIPEWNYDGSSTWQADSNGDTEIILKPCAIYHDLLRSIKDSLCYIVLCDTYDYNGKPTTTNHRHIANILFNKGKHLKPWFGLEQEYFMITNDEKIQNNHGYHYCGKADSNIERQIAEEHMKLCVETGIQISGINSEVSKFQWEFQVGPCEGISAGDELIVARYLLERVAEKYNVGINYHPKPDKNINGSGCHVNFSSEKTRCENGINEINRCLACLSKNHNEIINFYGDNNQLRLTGFHETSSYDKFSWGIGTRNTSVRIPNSVFKENCGYFEDRRPASNIDPYLATSNLFKTCYLEGEHV